MSRTNPDLPCGLPEVKTIPGDEREELVLFVRFIVGIVTILRIVGEIGEGKVVVACECSGSRKSVIVMVWLIDVGTWTTGVVALRNGGVGDGVLMLYSGLAV
jgi:hypothetical protein